MDTKNTQHVTDARAHVTLDQCRVAFIASIANHFIRILMKYPALPNGTNRNVIKQTHDQLEKCICEIRRTTVSHEPHYLDRNLKEAKILDIATVIDAVARIGIEEGADRYEEFFGLVVDCIDSVFYAQQNRKNLHFGKYKALFKMLVDEIHADVNGKPGQLLYSGSKKQLFVRVADADQSEELK